MDKNHLEHLERCPVGFCNEYLMSASVEGKKYHVSYIHGMDLEKIEGYCDEDCKKRYGI